MTSRLVLTHGAGAGHQSDFLTQLRMELNAHQTCSVEPITFDYMKIQESNGKKRPPPRFPTLVTELEAHIKNTSDCVLAGKSMGSRVATQLTELPNIKGVVCYGFPFYPQGKPEKNRLSFLENLAKPCLIIQGTRDGLGNFDWVNQQTLNSKIQMHWIEGADHDFKLLKKYQRSQQDVIAELAKVTLAWLKQIAKQ
ncbi:alpha/beta family hydrolase [Marinomonas sp. THO17]|uniref:alpha/beta family hydrolase n=1 Tax=Marinomonas sp. THO17 TaxID=3149048 RepID=UPI00336C2DD5